MIILSAMINHSGNMDISLCLSGNLGEVSLNHILKKDKIKISCVFTDSKSDGIINLCSNYQIPCFIGNPRKESAIHWLQSQNLSIGHLLSINYLFILDSDMLKAINGYAINFHGSLLPKYRGRTPHVWAIINGESKAGITAHLMNDLCDDGDIIKQIEVPIDNYDTGATLLEKYNTLYPLLIDEVLNDIISGHIKPRPQDATIATYYSKRTPADGKINWDWQKERIRNWCRAQAFPYPGAFAYLKGDKIIINQVEDADAGYMDTWTNGKVIGFKKGKPIIKVQNGALSLENYLYDHQIKLNDTLE